MMDVSRQIQDRLASDPNFREAFILDPVVALQSEGVLVSTDAESRIRALLQQAREANGAMEKISASDLIIILPGSPGTQSNGMAGAK